VILFATKLCNNWEKKIHRNLIKKKGHFTGWIFFVVASFPAKKNDLQQCDYWPAPSYHEFKKKKEKA
jgi:hypothetical protein